MKRSTLLIKHMVSMRCIHAVENILRALKIPFAKVFVGEIELSKSITSTSLAKLEAELRKFGFELVGSRIRSIIGKIKSLVLDHLNTPDEEKQDLSSFITSHIPYEYNYLDDLFSSVEGTSIEQFFIAKRIEKVKELLVYDQLSLSVIAAQTGYSSASSLSSQFKKITGLDPSHFRKIGESKKRSDR